VKTWADDHPKAKLMARKRAAIVQAAKAEFLKGGYDGTSMDAVAAAAGVSIMTLYRHTTNKDDLFGAIIAAACQTQNPEEEAALQNIVHLPTPEALHAAALHMQEVLTSPETVALMRIVIAETARFPQLGQIAYDGFVLRLERIAAEIFAIRPETAQLSDKARTKLGQTFVDQLMGTQLFGTLLGLAPPDLSEMSRRAREVSASILKRNS
jgi:TetR/AcrR family transcriptional repressor of mexJK operon